MNHTVVGDTTKASVDLDHRASRAWRLFGVIAQPQSYRNVAYLLLGLLLGTTWFTVLVTGVAVGVSMLVVALVGIPLLLGLWYVTRSFANIERGIANTLLGHRLGIAAISAPSGNLWIRLRAMSTDRARWREFVYLMLRFPIGVATFVVAATCLTTSVAVVYAPFYARYDDDPSFGDWSMSSRLDDVASSSPWSWLLVPLGTLVLIVSFHMMNALAAACGRWTAARLGVDETSRALSAPAVETTSTPLARFSE